MIVAARTASGARDLRSKIDRVVLYLLGAIAVLNALVLDTRIDTDLASAEQHERITALGGAPVLMIGETIDFVENQGASMALILEKSKIRI